MPTALLMEPRLEYLRAQTGDEECDHEMERRPGDYRDPEGQRVQLFECIYCPATEVCRQPLTGMVTALERDYALGR